MQIRASARPPSWKLCHMVPGQLALGLALTTIVLAIPFASLSSTNSNKSEQRPEPEKCHASQKKVSAAELATLEVGTVKEEPPKAGQVPEVVKPPEKIKHPQKEKTRKRKATLRQQDRQVQSGLIPEPGIPKDELGITGKLTTVTGTIGSEKGKAINQNRHSSDIPNKDVSNVVTETAQSTSEAKPATTSLSRQSLGPPGKEPPKGSKKPCASHADLAEEDTKMKNQPYPRVKIEEDPKESKFYAECAVRCITGKRMIVFTDGGSCAQASSAAFTYICLLEEQAEWQGHWHDESYGIIGDIRPREAEMIALTKALEVVEMEAKRQALDAESPLRVFVFTDSRDSLYFCQAISTNGKLSSASRSLAKDNVSRALEGMINRMQSMKSTVQLELHWVKGHSSVHHNKRADKLATGALRAVTEHIQNTRHETARDSRGYDLIPFTDMEQRPKRVIAQRARAIGQELQKEMKIATQQQIDTMLAFQARLEAQSRAVEPTMGVLNRFVTNKDSGLADLHPETVAVTSQRSPRGTKGPDDKPIDVASAVRSQIPEHYAQGIATGKQGCTGENPEPMGKGKIEELTDKNITQKRLHRSRQAALVFLRISKSLRAWFR
ncbi:hypothetical protein PG985_004862 [Apiospora marii]|uniref:uncharacterized protein n=1 Tax=Apiospora marii TaxID=335849 RepID=UPI0031329672